jgi:hypothetical protein
LIKLKLSSYKLQNFLFSLLFPRYWSSTQMQDVNVIAWIYNYHVGENAFNPLLTYRRLIGVGSDIDNLQGTGISFFLLLSLFWQDRNWEFEFLAFWSYQTKSKFVIFLFGYIIYKKLSKLKNLTTTFVNLIINKKLSSY